MEMANADGDYLAIIDSNFLEAWMASAEVDQKALGNFAAITSLENPFLSAMLYKILGLSVILSKKLLRARRLRRLDPTRETKSLQLYHHIIWLSREGLLILEEFVLPMVDAFVELKILAYKLRASFYHIFVLFHNQPAIHSPGILSLSSNATASNSVSDPESPSKEQNSRFSYKERSDVISVTKRPPGISGNGLRAKVTPAPPPGLAPVQPPRPTSSFLLPVLDYTPTATACFNHASLLAERFLPGSHPLRLSIKLEYAAYLYDCLQDANSCRKMAKQAIADVYNAQEGMDDESFEDAAEIVGILGKMVKRGNKQQSASSSAAPSGTPKSPLTESNRTPPAKISKVPRAAPIETSIPTTLKTHKAARNGLLPAAVPDPAMMNPI